MKTKVDIKIKLNQILMEILKKNWFKTKYIPIQGLMTSLI
jgi:hypothetical protein